MAWAKSRWFLKKAQLGSIVSYLVCLGGYALPLDGLHALFDSLMG